MEPSCKRAAKNAGCAIRHPRDRSFDYILGVKQFGGFRRERFACRRFRALKQRPKVEKLALDALVERAADVPSMRSSEPSNMSTATRD